MKETNFEMHKEEYKTMVSSMQKVMQTQPSVEYNRVHT